MIVLVRHGQTVPNRDGRLLGRSDPALTELGRAQAEAAAGVVAALAPTIIVSSPLRRASDTAGVIARRSGLEVELDERLVEVDYGEWEGMPLGDIPEDVSRRWRSDPEMAPPGGESLAAVAARVAEWCEERRAPAVEQTIVAVTHVSPLKAVVAWGLGVGPEVAWRLWVAPASITRLGVRSSGGILLTFNETSHLEHLEAGPG